MSDEALHPELSCFIGDQSGMRVLKHRWVFGIPYLESQHHTYNHDFLTKQQQVPEAKENRNWSKFIMLHQKPWRLSVLKQIVKQLTDKEYWELLAMIWIDSENVWECKREWKTYLSSNRPGRENMMDEVERKVVDDLSNIVTVYRGCQKYNRVGYAWTLSREQGVWFAKRYFGKGWLLQALVSKSDILAYLKYRNEEEVIILQRPKEVTAEPVC